MNPTSLLFWYPKIRDLGIPMPKTECVLLSHPYSVLDGKPYLPEEQEQIVSASNCIGYPLFLRTDMMSGKHDWLRTCYVPDRDSLGRHVGAVIDDNGSKSWGDCDPSALVFREYIPLWSEFTAFNGLPIAAERRYFIHDGVVECHHPYWQEDAIEQSWKKPDNPAWKYWLSVMNVEPEYEVSLLTEYALSVGNVLLGYWSIDFALSRTREWYLIDMADGNESWHPSCKMTNMDRMLNNE